ncbi:transcription termination factor mterf5, chloroplastic [Nicotiana attenuata]|uniref:Transcription termination factor mterf5, chloroplastic n=1 Tax=Nicotiana attenuata TaxID=49451 RepID=A0A1J6IUF0_NICAT|nr:transcription termination factor mterf5, chloroplastic [Nicotiana attenuata]
MFGIGNNGATRQLYCIRLKLFCSTTTTANAEPNLLSEFLVNSLGFSTEKAISASSKVTCLKPRNNHKPELVVNYFKQIGLDNAQIKLLVSPAPRLLFADVDKTLKPKIKVFQELGFSGPHLVKVLSRSGAFLRTGLNTGIRPSIEYLRKLLGTDDSVAKAIKRTPGLLSYPLQRVMSPNISFLQNLGCSTLDIQKLILRNPRIFVQKTEWLEDIVQRVEKDFCIRRDSRMFFYGVEMLSSLSKSNLEMKLGIFRSFGWSDSDIITMVQRLPLCLTTSEVKLRNILKFYVEELGYETSYIASHPTLLMFSFEKRVLPRNKILKLLKEKQLIKKVPCFYTVIKCSESEFLENYVMPLRDEMPENCNLIDLSIGSRISVSSNVMANRSL